MSREIAEVLEPIVPGIHPGISSAEYDAIPALNCSSLKPGIDIAGKSYTANPRKIRWAYEDGNADRTMASQDVLDFGNAVHLAVLERDRFESEVVHYSGRRQGGEWNDFKAEHEGCLILKTSGQYGYDRIGRILNAVMSLPEWALVLPYLEACHREIGVTAREDGMAKKGLLDIVSDSVPALLDLKTTSIECLEKYARSYWELGYWISMGCYREWYNQAVGRAALEDALLIVLVVKEPFDLIVRPLDSQDLSFGHEVQLAACRELKRAIVEKRWYGAGGGSTQPCVLPTYAIPEGAENLEFAT